MIIQTTLLLSAYAIGKIERAPAETNTPVESYTVVAQLPFAETIWKHSPAVSYDVPLLRILVSNDGRLAISHGSPSISGPDMLYFDLPTMQDAKGLVFADVRFEDSLSTPNYVSYFQGEQSTSPIPPDSPPYRVSKVDAKSALAFDDQNRLVVFGETGLVSMEEFGALRRSHIAAIKEPGSNKLDSNPVWTATTGTRIVGAARDTESEEYAALTSPWGETNEAELFSIRQRRHAFVCRISARDNFRAPLMLFNGRLGRVVVGEFADSLVILDTLGRKVSHSAIPGRDRAQKRVTNLAWGENGWVYVGVRKRYDFDVGTPDKQSYVFIPNLYRVNLLSKRWEYLGKVALLGSSLDGTYLIICDGRKTTDRVLLLRRN